MLRLRALSVACVVLAGARVTSGGDPVAAPLPLVANPVAEAWAAHPPGAWVRYKLFGTDPMRRELVLDPNNEALVVLLQATEHEVLVKLGFENLTAGRRNLRWNNGEWERLERRGDRTAPLGVRFQDREAEVVEGREPREVGGRRLLCTTYEGADITGQYIKVWFHPSVPGGIVRREMGERKDGEPARVTSAQEVHASGSAPNGQFAWPVSEDPAEAWEEQETYLRWVSHPVGAWVRVQTTSTLQGQPPQEPWEQTFTLLETRPTRVDIAIGYSEGRPHWRSTYRWQRPLGAPQERGKVTEETLSGPETLVVAGASLSCSVRKRVRTSPFATVTVTEWLNPTVPGGVVQRLIQDKPGMLPRETREVVKAFGVREVRPDPLAAMRQPEARRAAPPALRPDPVAQAWASHKPGAWVRTQRYAFDPGTGRLVPTVQRLQILVQVNADDVVLQEREEVIDGAKRTWRWVFDQSHRLDRQAEALGAFHPAFDPWQDVPVVEGAERLTVAGKALDCRTLDAQEPASLGRRFRLWLAPGVPGGVVREEWLGDVGGPGQAVIRVHEAVAWGAKPDGKFPWPVPAKGTLPWVEQDEYLRWARTPVGSWVRRRVVITSGRGKEPEQHTVQRLLEVRPTRVILEVAGEMGIHVRDQQRWMLPPGEPGGYRVEDLKPERPTEVLVVVGQPLECTLRRRRITTSSGPSDVTEWLNPTVPGGVVQVVTQETIAGEEHTVQVVVEDFGGPE